MLKLDRNMEKWCFLFLLGNSMTIKRKQLDYIDHQNVFIVFACAIIMPTAHSSPVYVSIKL